MCDKVYMVPSCIVLDYRRTYSLKNSGGTIVVIIEILEISPKKIGIFQDVSKARKYSE